MSLLGYAVHTWAAFFLVGFYRLSISLISFIDKVSHCHVGLSFCLCIFAAVNQYLKLCKR